VKYAWIKSASVNIRTACRVLKVSRSGYYDWLRRKPSARLKANQRLGQQIVELHKATRQAYGTERTWQALNEAGIACGRHRVQRLRQENGIQSLRRKRFMRARSSYQRVQVPPNLLSWPFNASGKDRVWVADITYIPTQQGWLYLAVVMDMYSRRVVGWAMSDKALQELSSAALAMAIQHRKPAKGLIHHSDQGAQYTSKVYQQQLQRSGLVSSMSRKGMPYDNAVMESFFSSLKQELTHHVQFKNRDEARSQIFDYIEVFYNRQRSHTRLNFQSPLAFERVHCVA
jgi:putative transposase